MGGAVVLAALLLGCSTGGAGTPTVAATSAAATATAGAARESYIALSTFEPEVAIRVGESVTWINGDDVLHTVTANDHAWSSELLEFRGRYARTFTEAGRFEYHCTVHAFMQGVVVVR